MYLFCPIYKDKICVMPFFVHSSCVEDMNTLFLQPVFTFSLNVCFIFCKPTLSDILIFFILVELHNVDNFIACTSLTLTMVTLTLPKIYTAILMMNKIVKILYIPIIILLLEPVMAPIIWLKEGGNPTQCPHIRTPKFSTNNKPMGYLTYIYLQYSGVLSMLHSAPLLLVMHAFLYHCHAHWGRPINTSPWGGMTSTDIQLFISLPKTNLMSYNTLLLKAYLFLVVHLWQKGITQLQWEEAKGEQFPLAQW